jgi:hypothetical protein
MKTSMRIQHRGFFGREHEKKTEEFVRGVQKNEGADVIVMSHHSRYEGLSQSTGNDLVILEPPTDVPVDVWMNFLSFTFCETFGLGMRAQQVLKDVLKKLRILVIDRDRSLRDVRYYQISKFVEGYQTSKESDLRINGKKMPFAEQEMYAMLIHRFYEKDDCSLMIPNACFPSFNEAGGGLVIDCEPLTAEENHFTKKVVLGYHYFERKYRRLSRAVPCYVVIDQPQHLFPKEFKRDPLHVHEPFIEEVARMGRHYNIGLILAGSDKKRISDVVLENSVE